MMNVGVLKELKNGESRAALTPAAVQILRADHHRVLVEHGAGEGSGLPDELYVAAGAELVCARDIYDQANLILKIKEPLPEEIDLLREGQVLFTYLHLAADEGLTRGLLDSGVTAIGYETVEAGGKLPLLVPMSEIAGILAAQVAMTLLLRVNGGPGKLLGGAPGVAPANVVVLGGGIVGENAAKIAARLGARVVVVDVKAERLRRLGEILPPNASTLFSNRTAIREQLKTADVVIGAALIPGGKAPHLVRRADLALLPSRAVLIDVSIDQGGCFETSVPTTHSDPTYETGGAIHYCVSNMPGAVPLTSTFALCGATLPYIRELAAKGLERAIRENPALLKGVNIHRGYLTNQAVARVFDLPYTPLRLTARRKPSRQNG